MWMKKHPLIAFFVLAYALTSWIHPLLKFSPLLGIPGLIAIGRAARVSTGDERAPIE